VTQVRLIEAEDLEWIGRACRASGFIRPKEAKSVDEFLWKHTVALWVFEANGHSLLACYHDFDARHQLVQVCFVDRSQGLTPGLLGEAIHRVRATVPVRKVQAYVLANSPEGTALQAAGWQHEARLPEYVSLNGARRDCDLLALKSNELSR